MEDSQKVKIYQAMVGKIVENVIFSDDGFEAIIIEFTDGTKVKFYADYEFLCISINDYEI